MEYIETKYGKFPKMGLGTFSVVEDVLPEVVAAAEKNGCGLIDTAYKYRNESIIGQTLSEINRTSFLLETKVCYEQLLGNLRYLRLNRQTIKQAYKRACKNLCTDYIDVMLLHSSFPGYEKQFVGLNKLKTSRNVRMIGICNVSLENLLNLIDKTGIKPDVVQVEIHPYYTNLDLVSYCQKNDIIVEARSPLAHGDAMDEWRQEPILCELASKYNVSIPQIILRWLTQQDIVALPRTSDVVHLKENILSFCFSLTKEELISISSLNRDRSYGFISKHYKR